MMRPHRALIGLILILLLEFVVFVPSFSKFYCGDSLYWFSRVLQGWDDLVHQFCTIDGLGQYRPFTFVFYSYLLDAGWDTTPGQYSQCTGGLKSRIPRRTGSWQPWFLPAFPTSGPICSRSRSSVLTC
jgi:hypothetical protein